MRFKKSETEEILSILGEGSEMSGEITFSHGLRVEGLVRGKLQSEGSLVIGAKGRIEAEAFVRRVSVNGEYRGAIHASDRVEIHREGKVYGDIFTPCLIIEAGAVFEGRCNMSENKSPSAEDASRSKILETGSSEAKSPGTTMGSEFK